MPLSKRFSFLTDHNVPMSVNKLLKGNGYDVIRSDTVCAPDAPDPIVAEAAIQTGRVLISWDRDFNSQKFKKPRFRSMSRVSFHCPEPQAAERLKEVFELFECAFRQFSDNDDGILVRIDRAKFQVRDKRLDLPSA